MLSNNFLNKINLNKTAKLLISENVINCRRNAAKSPN